jgi:hypothetical protein
MTKYELIFIVCFGSLMVFLINANFQNIIWEFLYFYLRIIALLFAAQVMIERANNIYERKLATSLKTLFLVIFGWEIVASISWSFANTKAMYLVLFVIVIILITNLAYWMNKNKRDERKNRHTT